MNFQRDQTEQAGLFAFSHRDLVTEDSDVWLYMDLFDQLDLEKFNRVYSYQGQAAKEPRLMLRTIFYGLTHGVVSGRRISDACRNDNRFIVLSGNLRPDQRTFNRFLERHEKSLMELFADIVRLAQAMGLVSLGRVAIDGSRFKGKTGVTHSMQYEKMGRAIGYIEEELAELRADLKKENETQVSQVEDKVPEEIRKKEARLAKIKRAKEEIEKENKERGKEEIKPEERKSLNDPEALSLASRFGRYQFGYNAQAVVDDKAQIIVACDLHPSATDYEALPWMLDQVKENCDKNPKAVLADLGYKSAENIHAIESRGIDAYVAIGKTENGKDDYGPLKEAHPAEQVTKNGDDYECMAGKRLAINKANETIVEFAIIAGFCENCPHSVICKLFFSEPKKETGRQKRKSFSIPPDALRDSYKKYLVRARAESFPEVYKRRKVIVEPVFGNLKNKGIRILTTGRKKVKVWWRIACTAHNIEKIVRYGMAPALGAI